MGNSQDCISVDNSFRNRQDLVSSLIPIEQSHNHNEILAIGPFEILRFKHEPYELIMRHTRSFPHDHPKSQEYAAMARLVASRLRHKNIAKIHTINLCSKSNICKSQMEIETYSSYYAINLQQIIDQRKAIDYGFSPGQIWYILHALTDLSHYLREKQLYFGIYLPRNIHLSIEGYLKVYLFHLTPNNEHLLYHHMAKSPLKERRKCLPLAPECLPLVELKMEQLRHMSLQKMDVFGIGMIALEAMLFSSNKKYYKNHQNLYTFDHKLLQSDLQQLKETYPTQLVHIIEQMTRTQPNERIGLEETRDCINRIRDSSQAHGSIKMLEDEDSERETRPSYKNSFKQKENERILKSITSDKINGESKLQFIPLHRKGKERRHNAMQLSVAQHGQKRKNKLSLSKEKKGIVHGNKFIEALR